MIKAVIFDYNGVVKAINKYFFDDVESIFSLSAQEKEYAKNKFDPKPKIIQLRVYTINKPAIALYKKMGFKIVAKLPKQIQYKRKLVDEFIMNKYL